MIKNVSFNNHHVSCLNTGAYMRFAQGYTSHHFYWSCFFSCSFQDIVPEPTSTRLSCTRIVSLCTAFGKMLVLSLSGHFFPVDVKVFLLRHATSQSHQTSPNLLTPTHLSTMSSTLFFLLPTTE